MFFLASSCLRTKMKLLPLQNTKYANTVQARVKTPHVSLKIKEWLDCGYVKVNAKMYYLFTENGEGWLKWRKWKL